MLKIKDLTVQLGGKVLFNRISLILNAGDKVGIAGVNGSGKSTLLKTIVGQITPETGEITMDGNIGYLSQEVHIDNSITENEYLTVEDYLNIEFDIQTWEINKFMNFLNLDGKDAYSVISDMSGGQKVKVEIMKMLLSEPDLLVLDEPTNFLDIPTTEWLMSYLVKYPKSVLVVSHDLRLMNKAIDKIWYLNEFSKQVEVYNENYEEFLLKKEAQDSALSARLKLQDRESIRLHKVADRKKAGVGGKGAIAARIHQKADEMKENTEKERVQLQKSAKMNLSFDLKKTPGRKILTTKSISKSYDKTKVLKSVDMEILRGERVVIIGKNGAGKSTLLKILTGNTPQNSGEYEWGHNVDVGYYAQEYEGIDYSLNLLENLRNDARLEGFSEQDLRKVLGGFQFSGEKVYQQVASLSGGEKTRLALSKLFAGGFNTLVLDEPTTYLDPHSKDILLGALKNYEGTMILVSHLPDFVRELEPTKVLLMPEEKFTRFKDEYIELVGIEE
jgi:ATPase subunit of ABC transporter with duplicated ATPase domains